MNERLQILLDEIRQLEQRVADELAREKDRLGYQLQQGRVQFEHEVARRHHELAVSIGRYLRESSWPVALTAPIIYALIGPLLLLDLFATAYQWLCFPIYKVPRVLRSEFFVFDRSQLGYLNAIERAHCAYCSYATGLLAYTGEIAARTEQYWCPIKHARIARGIHGRYHRFFSYGDAEQYRQQLETLRRDFNDLTSPESTHVPPTSPPS